LARIWIILATQEPPGLPNWLGSLWTTATLMWPTIFPWLSEPPTSSIINWQIYRIIKVNCCYNLCEIQYVLLHQLGSQGDRGAQRCPANFG
jgi:hypothetical protein